MDRLADLPVGAAPALALVPFRQIAERGFDVRDDGTPLSVLVADEAHELGLAEVLAALPAHDVRVEDRGFDVPDGEYAEIVRRVIRDEIGRGEGANFVIRRTFRGEIPGFGRADALALFRRLLAGERGAYWTFVVHTGGSGPEGASVSGRRGETGGRTLVGASPEVHVRMSGGTVVMNPISGTYRYPDGGPTAESLLAFLGDRKESEELSMVVDEELKMMCTVGDMGGVVVGPRLKEMAHLAHTEYELRGKSSLDVREVLRETMFAATVTGSPVQNACRVIERYESGGRGYYAGALALLGRDANGAQTLDSPILIRTADIAPDGGLRVPVGATLVRHSDPESEVAETHAKAAGVLAALGVRPGRPAAEADRPRLADDPRVRAALDGGATGSRRSGCGCGSASGTCPVTRWWWTARTRSPRCWPICCGPPVWTSRCAATTSRGCARRSGHTRDRWCWAPARGTRAIRATRRCGCCGRSPPNWCGTTGTGCWGSASGMS